MIKEIGLDVGSPNLPLNDPLFGGINAELLFVMKAPEADADPRLTNTRFLSLDNDDDGAANIFDACRRNDIARSRCVAWNICPFPIDGKNPSPSELRRAAPYTPRVLSLLPNLKVVVLHGGPAQDGWDHRLLGRRNGVKVITGASPSPPGINRQTNRSSFERAIRDGATHLSRATDI
ncbi:uracil-DNA glycosylase family protein [Antrihabitans spumae]|uniref:Uracil-DNA glycosylase family protein n=1 Tax=Antrihabitans spumae TaxID=3373370 RepID=A0ABW7KWR3_9NOCA